MANPHETTGANEPKRRPQPSTDDEGGSKSNQRTAPQSQGESQRSTSEDDRDNPDQVEIGDPIPENDRTIRSTRGGETGEDEDLPGSDRGETGEDEDLPDDDAGIETPGGRH